VTVSVHQKSVRVFRAVAKHSSHGINSLAILSCLKLLLGKKLAAGILQRQTLADGLYQNDRHIPLWLVSCGTVARYAEEQLAVEAALESLSPCEIGHEERC